MEANLENNPSISGRTATYFLANLKSFNVELNKKKYAKESHLEEPYKIIKIPSIYHHVTVPYGMKEEMAKTKYQAKVDSGTKLLIEAINNPLKIINKGYKKKNEIVSQNYSPIRGKDYLFHKNKLAKIEKSNSNKEYSLQKDSSFLLLNKKVVEIPRNFSFQNTTVNQKMKLNCKNKYLKIHKKQCKIPLKLSDKKTNYSQLINSFVISTPFKFLPKYKSEQELLERSNSSRVCLNEYLNKTHTNLTENGSKNLKNKKIYGKKWTPNFTSELEGLKIKFSPLPKSKRTEKCKTYYNFRFIKRRKYWVQKPEDEKAKDKFSKTQTQKFN